MRGIKMRIVLGLLGIAAGFTCGATYGQALLENISTPQPVPVLPATLARAKAPTDPSAKTSTARKSTHRQAPVRQVSWQPPFGAAHRPSAPSFAAPAAANFGPEVPQAIAFFGSGAAAQTLATMPPRLSLPARVSTSVGPPKPRSKPFSGASNGSTVSPYLNLYREENAESAPNYYAFVRPQLKQQEMNRQQQSQLQKLQRQVQRTSAAPRVSATGTPLTGHRTRYMDTGGYFSNVGQ